MVVMHSISQTEPWWMRANFYSLYIDKFAGDIPTLIEKLDYFSLLGIDALHILPHYPSPFCDGGYDITDHTGVRSDLGTVEDFKNLCTQAHKRGLKIMVDLVLNHTSIEHPWFIEARKSLDNPKRDFYLWSTTGTEYKGAPNIFPDFKDANWLRNEATDDFYYATFKPCQPDLNWSNGAVQTAMLEVIDTLVSYGVDGFRLDAIMNLVEQEETNSVGIPATHDRIRDIRQHLDMHHPGVILLGEVVGTTEYSLTYFGASDECHLAYNFELMAEMLYAVRMGDEHDRLKTVLEATKLIPPKTSWMSFLRNHDSITLSTLGMARQKEFLKTLDPKSTFGFNKGTETAQRLFDVCGNEEAVRTALSMLYAVPSATVLYYGDEIGMQNAPLPPGEDDMRFTARASFDWTEAEKQMEDPDSLFHYAAKCIKNRPNVSRGSLPFKDS